MPATVAVAATVVMALVTGPPGVLAQRRPARSSPSAGTVPALETAAPDLHARLIGVERAQAVMLGALIAGHGTVDEAQVFQRMIRRLTDRAAAARPDPEADRGYAALGPRVSAMLRRGHAFHRDVVAIFAGTPPAARKAALDAAVARYQTAAATALPDAPKDMTILYDHPYTSFLPPPPGDTEPRRQLAYPALTGVAWSTHWYELALLEPLEASGDPDRRERDLATVARRLAAKLSFGEAPDAFPTELPLAPAIAPGLVAAHERAASILDNLAILQGVIADVLVRPAIADPRAVVDGLASSFADRQFRCVQTDEWILVALRHSIFAQGGPALGTMAADERNAFSGGHGQHYAARRAPPACDPQ